MTNQPAVPTTQGLPPRRMDSDLLRAASIFLLIFAIYFVGYSRTLPPTADEMIDFGLTESIAKWQIVSIDQVSTVGPNPEEIGADGNRYSKYGPLQAVLAVPLFWLAQVLPIGIVDTVLLLNHLLTALTGALLYLFVRRLGPAPGYSRAVSVGVVAVAVFGTPLWVESKRFFAEPTITLTIVAVVFTAYLAATTGERRWLVAAGVAFGLAVSAKYIDALLLSPIPLYLAWSELTTARTRDRAPIQRLVRTGWFAVGVAPIGILLGWYDFIRFGNALATGYTVKETFSTPVWQGVAGFLLSPGKSIFVYTPLFLLLFVWVAPFVRRFRPFSVMLGAVIALHLLVYGAWWVWWGAWAWGPRFIVPILPLIALFLVEGLATMHRPIVKGVVVVLALLSAGIQILGLAVDHTIYLVQLMPVNPRPDVLTLWNPSYSPIVHQISLLRRQWLDLAWILRDGPSWVDWRALGLAVLGVVIAVTGAVLVDRSRFGQSVRSLAFAGALVCGCTFGALVDYNRQADPTMAAVASVLASAPTGSAVIELAPDEVIPYANTQKRNLPELGWIDEPTPQSLITRRVDRFSAGYSSLYVLTDTPAKAPGNGIEATLDRSLIEVDSDHIGGLRLLHYLTRSAAIHFTSTQWQFGMGLTLSGYALPDGLPKPGARANLVLQWQATSATKERPDYTVFVHLVDADGRMIAQQDDPPASGYSPTSGWIATGPIYDDHTIDVPANAPVNLRRFQVGLYLPSTGQRLPVIGPDGRYVGDSVTIVAGST